ncbi:MAG: hypothetical protein WBA74_26180 [Cyclobacteriaceae bacterium]
MPQTGGIEELKKILFEEENQKYQKLQGRITEVKDSFDEKLKNYQLPEKEVDDLVDHITEIMPEKLGPAITRTLKGQIKDSRDEVVQVLYPIIGIMIKKYVQREVQQLSDRIDEQIDKTFSLQNIWQLIKNGFSGKDSKDIITEAYGSQIEQIFIIEQNSGILLASYSRTDLVDQDMISGMLTAIKSFIEDAFDKGAQELETIEYDLYKIYLKSFNKFYIATVISGVLTASLKNQLDDLILEFVKKMTMKAADVTKEDYEQNLEEIFKKLN